MTVLIGRRPQLLLLDLDKFLSFFNFELDFLFLANAEYVVTL